MFDTYRIQSGPSHVTTTEKRAPTDESVRLLREMEGAAKAAVISSIRLDNNTFKGVMHQYRDYLSARHFYRVVFDLNGRRHEVNEVRDDGELISEFAPKLRDAIAKEIARSILIDITTDPGTR